MIELTGDQSLDNLGECDLHRAGVLERRKLETVGHLIAKSAGAARRRPR
jgi:hypothetical protein